MRHSSMRLAALVCCVAGASLAGCFRTTATVRDPNEPQHFRKDWDFTDQKNAVEAIARGILESRNVAALADKPLIVVYGIQNDTTDHIKTQPIGDKIQSALVETGRVRLIDKTARTAIDEELAFQGGHVDPAKAVEKGKQIGATHVLYGTLSSMEAKEGKGIRLSKKSIKYYNLTVKLTDIRSGEMVYSKDFEVTRQESQPFFGW